MTQKELAHTKTKEVPSYVGKYQFQFDGNWFRMTHSDISVRVDGKILSVPIEQFDQAESVRKLLKSMIREAKKQDKD